jgi:hypothetical protein
MAKIKIRYPVSFLDLDYRALNIQALDYAQHEIQENKSIDLIIVDYELDDIYFEIMLLFFKKDSKNSFFYKTFNLNDLKYNYQDLVRTRTKKKKLNIFNKIG